MTRYHRVVIEKGRSKVFASAIDWPGWSRSAKTEEGAIQALRDYAERYRTVAERADVPGVQATADDLDIVERVAGSGVTDFGVPDRIAEREREPMTETECERQLSLLGACWATFDAVIPTVSRELRKGPRGGGRDRDEIVDHMIQADRGYARRIGLRTPPFDTFDADAVQAHRDAVYESVIALKDGRTHASTGWPARYFLRRAGWHVMDHTWELEDKDLGREMTS